MAQKNPLEPLTPPSPAAEALLTFNRIQQQWTSNKIR